MASTTLYIYIDLDETIGALEIGSLFSAFLFGIVTLQTYNYYNTFRDDGWRTKALVAAIWLLEAGHTAGISFDVYRVSITYYGKPQLLGKFVGIGSTTCIGGAISLLVQGFFSTRLWRLLPKPYSFLGPFCIFISFVKFVATVYLTVEGTTLADVTVYHKRNDWLISSTLVASVVTDVIIAASMIYYLLRKRGKSMKRVGKIIDRLIGFTIRSGFVTSLGAIVLLITFQVKPNSLIWMAVYTFYAKLYSNSLLSALNARKELRGETISLSLGSQPNPPTTHRGTNFNVSRRSHRLSPDCSLFISQNKTKTKKSNSRFSR
ncbi:hypothetical protein M413DRAFT_448372 [Hebeloma cylindrosporum]|uniref:DUF6534 domain-containing protein n=1 Tax=Hebeloma cylindrosporum TaxID=76867 RepID=A0A0C2XIB0_HEBCY|nr:hypothetical protein M413DRAFT_448372 [Hebeloma cylindrosporum h7]